jgi:membrane protein DedA with SNARE-associated domain/membrane-associated phospholipid phosphatase
MMNHTISQIVSFVHLHPQYGISFAFCIALIESLAIIGSIIPGTVTMTAIGSMIGTSLLPLETTLLVIILGAFIGDCLSFAIGFYYQDSLKNWRWIKRYHKWLTYCEGLFKHYGLSAILIGRFFGPMRSMIPLVAGLLNMRIFLFLFAALFASILWAIVYLIPGILLGAFAMDLPHHLSIPFIIKSLAILLISVLVIYAINLFFKTLHTQLEKLHPQLIHWLEKRPKWSRLFIKNKNYPLLTQQILQVCKILLGCLCLLIITLLVHNPQIVALNQAIYHLLQNMHMPWLTHIMLSLTLLNDHLFMDLFMLIFLCGCLSKKEYRYAILFLGTMFTAILSMQLLKHTLMIIRPPIAAHLNIHTFAYPSGHTTMVFVLLGFWAWQTWPTLTKHTIKLIRIISGILIASVAFSRIYLGVHWLTDVLGGLALGYTLLNMTNFIRNYNNQTFPHTKTLGLMTLLSVLCWGVIITLHAPDEQVYFSKPHMHSITEYSWLRQKNIHLPYVRLNRIGTPIDPLNVQWLGSMKTIKNNLTRYGWQSQNKAPTLISRLHALVNSDTRRFFPLLPPLYQKEPPALVMSKVNNGQFWTLRLWHADYQINHTPLWIGTVMYHPIPLRITKLKQLATPKDAKQVHFPLYNHTMITKSFSHASIKLIKVPNNLLHWSGYVALIKFDPIKHK